MPYHEVTFEQPFFLESGAVLPKLTVAYYTYGHLSKDHENVVWVCHALTANADPFEWWPGLVGPQDHFKPDNHFIVCANILGSCYGTTGPLSDNPETGTPFYHDFPLLTVRDIVKAHQWLAWYLDLQQISLLIGGSLGGQQVLEWAIQAPAFIKQIAVVACNAWHSPWGVAFNETQRMAIEADQTWQEAHPEAGLEGLRAARAMALLSYRHYQTYRYTQEEPDNQTTDQFRASAYQQYQGHKLARRFNAFSYWYLSKAMDTHNVGRNRGTVQKALQQITARSLIMGIQSDNLFPIQEQAFLARHIPNATVVGLDSPYGHDGFLLETEQISQALHQHQLTPHAVTKAEKTTP